MYPVMAALILALSRIFTAAQGVPPLVDWGLDLAICLGGALAGIWLFPSAITVGIALSLWLLAPDDAVPPLGIVAIYLPILSAVASGRRRLAALLSAWYIPVAIFVAIVLVPEPGPIVSGLAIFAFLLMLTWLVGMALNAQVRLREIEKTRYRDSISDLRKAIARDLHDAVAANLSRIVLRAQAAKLRGTADVTMEADLDAMLHAAWAGNRDLRMMLDVLRTEGATGDPAASEVWQTESISGSLDHGVTELERSGFTVDFKSNLVEDRVPFSVRSVLSKVIIESISNVIKHAQAGSPVSIMVNQEDLAIEAVFINRISNVVKGQSRTGFGLLGISERLRMVGGEFEHSHEGDVWALSARLTWEGNSA